MSILPIVTYNDQVLREKTIEVKELTTEVKQFIEDLYDTMYNADGVGIAAPQVGSSHRIFVIDPDEISEDLEGKVYGPMTFINPKIVKKWGEEKPYREGCLSLPDLFEDVKRLASIEVHYLNENFEEIVLEADGFLSRVIQHEIDHLEGILFIDYLSRFKKRIVAKKLKKIQTGEQETAYPLVEKG
jgi:peptide deformylase